MNYGINQNSKLNLFVKDTNHRGEGVSRVDGKVIFIPYAIPGETVHAAIVDNKKNYSRGVLKDIISPSPHRIEAKCPYYSICGGCSYQHIDYSQQLLLKQAFIKNVLRHIAGVNAGVKLLVGMKNPWNYRNKVAWHLTQDKGNTIMGFYKHQTNKLVDIEQCLLLSPSLNETSSIIREMIDMVAIKEKSAIMIRNSNLQDELMVEFINCFPREELLRKLTEKVQSIYLLQKGQKLLYGKKELVNKAGNYLFALGPHDFFQVNFEQNEKLIDLVARYLNLTGSEKVLDAYCGVGILALNMAKQAQLVVGIDSNHSAIRHAINNALLNNIGNCKFISGFCENVLPNLTEKFDSVIVDPPRAGLKEEFIAKISDIVAEKVVYVSCHPATLARDVKLFMDYGYKLREVQPLDMFPQTSHVESIALLQKD